MHSDHAQVGSNPSAQILLQATFEDSALLEGWTASLGTSFGLPAVLVQRIDLCLVEAVSNVIAYAYPRGVAGTVRVCFWRGPERIVVQIEDDGEAFDPTSYRVPSLPASLDDAPAGGRGIRLIRHYADETRYERDGATNRLTLVFRAAARRTGTERPISAAGTAAVTRSSEPGKPGLA